MPNGPLEQFKLTLERLLLRVEPVRGIKKAERALKWAFKKAGVKSILASVERQKSLFALAFYSAAHFFQANFTALGI